MRRRKLAGLSIAGGMVLGILILAKYSQSGEQTTGQPPVAPAPVAIQQPQVIYVPVPVQQTSSLAQQLLFDNGPAITPQLYTAPIYQAPPQVIEDPQSMSGSLPAENGQADIPAAAASFNPQTGEYYPGVAGGSINPQTGAFYPSVPGGGTIDPQTGKRSSW